jgi:carbon starvation protein CstA
MTPVPLRVASALLALEAVAAVAAAVGFAVAAAVGKPSDRGVAMTLVVLLVAIGAGLALVARGLWRRRPAAQTPAWLAQFFALVVAYYQRHTLIAVTIALAVVALVAVAALSAPESRAALRRDPPTR